MSIPSPSVTPERIMQLAWGYVPPLVLEAALHHRVFDVLDAGPKTIYDVHCATSASERGLGAIMHALVGLNFLHKDDQGLFSLTPESAAFLVSTKPSFQGGFLRQTSSLLMPKWLRLNHVVATGKPVHSVNQEGPGSKFFEQFVNDLFPMNYPAAQTLAHHLDAAALAPARVLDLAAGSGVWGIALAQHFNQAHVCVVDWPDVLSLTRQTVARFGLSRRFCFVEGDLLTANFGADHNVATLGHILHSEGRERSRALLQKTFQSLASGGVIAIAEFLVNADRTGPLNGLFFAVNMLVNTDHGDTFSLEEIGRWLTEAGFVHVRTLDAPGPSPLVLATKP